MYSAVCLAFCLAMVAGCSAMGGGGGGGGAPATVNLPSAPALNLPLDSYLLSLQQQVLIDRAVTRLADSCMKSYGATPPGGLLGGFVDLWGNESYYIHRFTVQTAEKYGYNPPSDALDKEMSKLQFKPRDHAQLILETGFGNAPTYDGKPVPPGGCVGKAEAALAGKVGSGFPVLVPPTNRFAGGPRVSGQLAEGEHVYETLRGMRGELLSELLKTAADEMQADPRIIAVTARWRQCMLNAGFDYTDPYEAQFDPRWGPPGTSATPAASRSLQIQVAVADARCEAKVNYSGPRRALLIKYENRVVNSHVTELEALKQAQAHLIANANAVLEGQRPS